MPEITVVITAYRLEKQIGGCLDELLGQTFQDFNVLVVDDYSPDGTAGVIRGYAAGYPDRIRAVYLSENLGSPAKTRNAALDSNLIDGKYVLFLDGDDHVEPDLLECLYSACRKEGAEVAVCAYDRVEVETGRVLCHELKWLSGAIGLPPAGDEVAFLNGALWNKLIRMDRIGTLRIPDFQVGEDTAFALKVFQRCGRIACVPRELAHYQVRADSVIANTQEATMRAFAGELAAQYAAARDGWRETIALLSFLHIGLSMALRAADNPSVSLGRYLKSARAYMRDTYHFYRGMRCMRLSSLRRHGLKGLVVWLSLWMYRAGCFRLAVGANRLLTRLFHVDFKF